MSVPQLIVLWFDALKENMLWLGCCTKEEESRCMKKATDVLPLTLELDSAKNSKWDTEARQHVRKMPMVSLQIVLEHIFQLFKLLLS